MADSWGDVLPWPLSGPGKREEATGETTQGRVDPTPWVVVGVNLTPAEAAIIKARLESYDIPAIVQQEAIGSIFGLTVGPLGSARVLAPEPLAERALEILAETFEVGNEFDDKDFDDQAYNE
jgi:hypothetical protein